MMNKINFAVVGFLIFASTVRNEELLELKCLNETECKQFHHSGINASCIKEHCQCSGPTGNEVPCKPLDRKLNNIIGGPCPCPQENSECNMEQDICYCARDFMTSSDKRRCIKNIAYLGDECELDLQCQRGDNNGLCIKVEGKCFCNTLFANDNGTCASILSNRLFCKNDTLCTDNFGINSKCSNDTGHCVCAQGYIASEDKTTCLKVPKYLQNCTQNLECVTSMGPGGACVENVCQCGGQYFLGERKLNDGTLEDVCLPRVKRGQYCRYPEDCYQRQLNESEQSLRCVYGECNCKPGYLSYNDGECMRGDDATKVTLSYFVFLALVLIQCL